MRAYDYGLDEQGAYYTMELLCSALSLLHSRRLVYRDLNRRNVYCADAGPSKLIDFGAVTGMGTFTHPGALAVRRS